MLLKFQINFLNLDGWMDGRHRQTNTEYGWMDGTIITTMDRQMNGWMDGWNDKNNNG